MSLTNISNLYAYISDCQHNSPNLEECEYIMDKISQGQISQIIFDFGENTILCLLRYFIHMEDYKLCDTIDKKIKIHNRVNNTNIEI